MDINDPSTASSSTPCVFCEIVAGRALASIVYKDDRSLVAATIGPVNPGHLLVMPKRHAPYLDDLEDRMVAHLFTVAKRSATAIRRSGLRCEGINLFLADGEAAFQEVFHLHIHVIPRFRGDAFKIEADWSVKPPREDLDRIAAQIRQQYRRIDEPRLSAPVVSPVPLVEELVRVAVEKPGARACILGGLPAICLDADELRGATDRGLQTAEIALQSPLSLL